MLMILILYLGASKKAYFFVCFLDVLADNGRLTLTGDVITAFGKMMSAHRGEVLCSVTTAQVQTADYTRLATRLKCTIFMFS